MHVTLIVGAGGTGSYFIEDIVHYYNTLKDRRHIIVVDGDTVEQKNLLRQGFLKMDLDKGKSDTLVNRYKKIVREGLTMESKNQFINSVDDVVNVLNGLDVKEITIVSCVDNNMARLRLTFALYALRDQFKIKVQFVDSGNAEWYGQTITSVLEKKGDTYFQGLYRMVKTKGREGALSYVLEDLDDKHIVASIFTTNDEWKDHLTKGDHEMSCDDIAESNPQNIGTNMMASKCLLMTVGMLERKEFAGGEYNFDAKSNSISRRHDKQMKEVGYEERIQELLDYVRTKEGYIEVFGTEGVEVDEETEKRLLDKHRQLEAQEYKPLVESDLDELLDLDALEEEEIQETIRTGNKKARVRKTKIRETLVVNVEEVENFFEDVFSELESDGEDDLVIDL